MLKINGLRYGGEMLLVLNDNSPGFLTAEFLRTLHVLMCIVNF